MEKQIEDEFKVFNTFCKKAMKASLSIRPLIEQNLNSEELSLKEKINWLTLESKVVEDKIKAFVRPEYIDHLKDIKKLYELFKKRGCLYNADELSKLEQAMNLYEKYTWLQILLLNARQTENRSRKQNNNNTWENTNDSQMNAIAIDPMMVKLDERIHLATPPNTIGDWVKMATCHDLDQLKGPYRIGCRFNEFKCFMDGVLSINKNLNYANIERSGLFYTKKGKKITAHHLTTSTYEKLKTRDDIQKIIGEYIKKVG